MAKVRPSDVYPEVSIGGFTRLDGTVAFFSRVNALVDRTSVVLDVGCGRGAYAEDPVRYRRDLRVLRGRVRRVVGLDVDVEAAANPFVDEFRLLEGDVWPIESESIDVAVADYVMEHVASPRAFFSEARRVLRPGGTICIRTPNRLGYAGIAAQLIPNSLHARVTARVQDGRQERDVFPTYYRCNTAGALRAAMRDAGLDPVVITHESEPSYLAFSRVLYRLGAIYARLAPSVFQNNLFAFGRVAH